MVKLAIIYILKNEIFFLFFQSHEPSKLKYRFRKDDFGFKLESWIFCNFDLKKGEEIILFLIFDTFYA